MPDIEMRFHRDMIVLSATLDGVLARQGFDFEKDGREFLNAIEPEAVEDALRMEQVAGASCLLTNTAGITKARLAHFRMDERSGDLARAALELAASLSPQHILSVIGPSLLPIDPASASSLKQNRDQYAQAARDFGGSGYDGFLLDGMRGPVDLKCALMGLRMVSDAPVFSSIPLGRPATADGGYAVFAESLEVMGDMGADVAGFSSSASLDIVTAIAAKAASATPLPLFVQIDVEAAASGREAAMKADSRISPDAMVDAALGLRAAGVQFLRAGGFPTPAYTGALAMAVTGLDCSR